MTKRRLGQNFLYDPGILQRTIEVSGVSPEDTVVEIGPGPGRLTRMLAGRVKRVVAIELDPLLHERLKGELSSYTNVELIHGDALRFPYATLGDFKVVANIPYYITTPILFTLLDQAGLNSATLMVQREVAERIVAKPGGKEYGVLSVMVQYRARPSLKFIVPRGAFRPAPKVDSAVIHLSLYKTPPVDVHDERLFTRVVKAAFSQRRKTLANSLKPLMKEIKEILLRAGIEPTRRAETLSIEEFARLSNVLGGEKPTTPNV